MSYVLEEFTCDKILTLDKSDIGWVVGHSYIIYAPLLVGAATVLFEGKPVGTPDSSTLWRIIQEYKVTSLFTAPSKCRWRKLL